jgi:hypothetical protein
LKDDTAFLAVDSAGVAVCDFGLQIFYSEASALRAF